MAQNKHSEAFDAASSWLEMGRIRMGICADLGIIERPRETAGVSVY